jgi:hypothetical protein
MNLDADGLLRAVESHPASIREGADSLVLLYCWRREGGDPAGFMAAVEALVGQGLVAILPGPDMRLRLTAEGFQRLDAELPEAGEPAEPMPVSEDEHVWQGSAATAARETPPAELAGCRPSTRWGRAPWPRSGPWSGGAVATCVSRSIPWRRPASCGSSVETAPSSP